MIYLQITGTGERPITGSSDGAKGIWEKLLEILMADRGYDSNDNPGPFDVYSTLSALSIYNYIAAHGSICTVSITYRGNCLENQFQFIVPLLVKA